MRLKRFGIIAAIATMAISAFGKTETLRIPTTADGDSIYGVLATPDLPTKKTGIAIISHGFNGSHKFGGTYFDTLNQLGYAVYTFDFPNGSTRSLSGNNTMEMSIPDEVNALKGITEYFKSRADIDPSRIVLIGESQGGLVSALTAADLKDEVQALVLIYPALCIPDNWNERYPRLEDIPEKTDVWGVPLGRRFFEEIKDLDPYARIAGYDGPVLIIHGTDDKVVPLSYSRRARETYENARLEILEKEGHGFSEEGRKKSNAIINDFLK